MGEWILARTSSAIGGATPLPIAEIIELDVADFDWMKTSGWTWYYDTELFPTDETRVVLVETTTGVVVFTITPTKHCYFAHSSGSTQMSSGNGYFSASYASARTPVSACLIVFSE